jgi:hypothetical protein
MPQTFLLLETLSSRKLKSRDVQINFSSYCVEGSRLKSYLFEFIGEGAAIYMTCLA